MYTVLKLCWPFEGNHGTDVAPGEHEFDTLGSLFAEYVLCSGLSTTPTSQLYAIGTVLIYIL